MTLFPIPTLEHTEAFANTLAKELHAGSILLLNGGLGCGKTTFIQFLCKALNIDARVKSPSYTLIHQYKGPIPVIHMDLYRLESYREIESLDLIRYLTREDSIICIEWAEKLQMFKPETFIQLDFAYTEDENRRIHVHANGVSLGITPDSAP